MFNPKICYKDNGWAKLSVCFALNFITGIVHLSPLSKSVFGFSKTKIEHEIVFLIVHIPGKNVLLSALIHFCVHSTLIYCTHLCT